MSYLTDTEWLADARDDARLEADYEDGRAPDSTCPECGYEWHAGVIPATRYDPADARWPDCPRCEGLVS